MLGLFGNKSDHPLANIKSVQLILDNLPKNDMVATLDEIGHSIEALFDEGNAFRLDHQFTVLRMLDEVAHPFLQKIVQAYFAPAAIAGFQENRFWGALNAYYTFSELGYHKLLIGVREEVKGSAALKAQLALICSRGIYSVLGRMECAAVRYMPIDQQAWVHLADFYDLAAVEDCLDDELQIYPGGASNMSVSRIFACTVMWYSIGVGVLRPLELHMARSLVTHLRKYLSVTDTPQSDSMFIFDLAHPLDPARAKEDGAMYPASTRFIKISVPAGYFDGILKTLAKDIVPDELNFGVAYSAEQVTGVINHVAEYCKLPLPSRKHQRRKISMKVKVLSGYANLIEQSEVGLNFDSAAGEHCEVEDISASGLKYIIPAAQAGDLKIGSLIGVQPDKAEHWGAGVVRRLRRDAQNNLHVGVRILANKVIGVVLQQTDNADGNGMLPALYIARNDESSGENWLLMKSDTFSSSRSQTMVLGEQDFLMMPVGLIEKGADFDLVRYRKMIHERGGEVE